MALVRSSEGKFDPTLSTLRQAQDLTPNSSPRRTPSSPSSEERWADMAVDHGEYEVTEDIGLFIEGVEELDSVGGKQHDSGRCKPCAFYHTKGCQSGADCQFCHRCPAHEKQRRKRLRRQLCNSLIHGFDSRGRGQGDRSSHPKKAGHARVSSDTTSTCSGWLSNSSGQYAHSRHSSTSSLAASVYELGDSANLNNVGYVQSQTEPVYGYQSGRPQLMSSQMEYRSLMQPMEEFWSENPQQEVLDNMPVLEARAWSATSSSQRAFPATGDVLNTMPQMPATDITSQQELPPPPSGVPKVMDACLLVGRQAPRLSLPIGDGANYEHDQALPSGMSSPVGYISCSGYQYAIVPVPMNQYEIDAGSSPIHQGTQACAQASQLYHPEQGWDTTPYQCAQDIPLSPVGVGTVMGSSQWW